MCMNPHLDVLEDGGDRFIQSSSFILLLFSPCHSIHKVLVCIIIYKAQIPVHKSIVLTTMNSESLLHPKSEINTMKGMWTVE